MDSIFDGRRRSEGKQFESSKNPCFLSLTPSLPLSLLLYIPLPCSFPLSFPSLSSSLPLSHSLSPSLLTLSIYLSNNSFLTQVGAKRTLEGVTYQSTYPGTPLPKQPSEGSRINRCTLVHPCQKDPLRHHVPIVIPWYTHAKTTLEGVTCQSAYPGTPLPKQPLEASRTNRRTLVRHCQNNLGGVSITYFSWILVIS